MHYFYLLQSIKKRNEIYTGSPLTFSMGKGEGFTLIEIVLSIALIGILAASFFSVFKNFQIGNDLDLSSFALVQSLRRAQLLSRAVSQDSTWGVKTQSDKIVIFKGASFAGRDAAEDEIIEFPSPLSISGKAEIVFQKFSGEPNETGQVTLTSASGTSREISLNKKGMLSY